MAPPRDPCRASRDIRQQILDRLPGAGLGEMRPRAATSPATSRSSARNCVLGQHALRLQPRRVGVDRATLLPALDLGLVAVQLGVEHRVRAEAVGAQLQEQRPACVAHPRRGRARRVVHRDHVHAVDAAPSRRRRPRALAAQVGLRLRARQRRAHRVEVVLAAEQHRQLPQRGQVHATRGTRLRPPRLRRRSRRSRAARAAAWSASASPTASGRPPPTMALPPIEARGARRTGASSRRARASSLRACRTSRP